ncbi:2541_t:CDS:1, partial [Funneliformis caledonium]
MTSKKVSTTKRTLYTVEEKLIVNKYAQENGRNAAVNHFDLNGSMIG